MLANNSLVEVYNLLETKRSVVIEKCTTKACPEQKFVILRVGVRRWGMRVRGIVDRFKVDWC
jgi:hypothetical protein